MIRRRLVTCGFGVLLAAALAGPAHATYPGSNGEFGYETPRDHKLVLATWTARADGTHRARLGQGIYGASWSATGRLVAGVQDESLVLTDPRGHVGKRLPIPWSLTSQTERFSYQTTALSPDGRDLLAVELRITPAGREDNRIWLVPVDGSPPRIIAHGFDPRWAPRGHTVYYERAGASWTGEVGPARVGISGGRPTTLIHTPYAPYADLLDVSPDGRHLLLGGLLRSWSRICLWRTDLHGGHARCLRSFEALGWIPAATWSPDARTVAYSRRYPASRAGIYRMPAGGGRAHRLFRTDADYVIHINWQPHPRAAR